MSKLSNLFNLTGRTAIVTGGAGLLGTEFCKSLAEAGAAVIVADVNIDAAQDVAESLTKKGHDVVGFEIDITSEISVGQLVVSAIQQFKQIDILVNSAAIDPKFDQNTSHSNSGVFEEYPLTLWQDALAVNLTGTMLCCRAVSKPMLEKGQGVIVNISSMYGIVGPDQRLYEREGEDPLFKPVYYSVTKAGILGLTRYLATYFAGKNIRVNALTPGGVYNDHDEDFLSKYADRSVLGRMADKDELNGALLFLASDASKYMTGANLIVDGGWTAW